jgi:hypothetical protein
MEMDGIYHLSFGTCVYIYIHNNFMFKCMEHSVYIFECMGGGLIYTILFNWVQSISGLSKDMIIYMFRILSSLSVPSLLLTCFRKNICLKINNLKFFNKSNLFVLSFTWWKHRRVSTNIVPSMCWDRTN